MLRDDINNALTEAMKAKNKRGSRRCGWSIRRSRTPTSRRAAAASRPLADADVLGLLQKMIKQRQESVELYDKGGRAELVKQEQEEIEIISAYLPKQMSEAEWPGGDRRGRSRRPAPPA